MRTFIIGSLLLLVCIAAHSQRYKRIHRKAIVADTHNDVLSTVIMDGLHLEDDLTGKAHSDFKRFKKGGVDVQVFAIWCDSTFRKDTAFTYANIEIDSLYAIANRNPEKMSIVRSPEELRMAVRKQKLAAMIGVEGGHMIEDNLAYLDSLYARGARYLTLTWNNSTSWASSAFAESTADSSSPKGLNEFGKGLIKHMNDIGMMVDVSHAGEQTFWDVINTTTKPLLASHSCAYALAPHSRNLKDEQIRAIAKNGGVIQLNFYSAFLDSNFNSRQKAFYALHQKEIDSMLLTQKGPQVTAYLQKNYGAEIMALNPPISVLFDHLDHIVKLVGVNHIGLGSDFDGISSAPADLGDVSQFPNITKGLIERGYSKRDIRKIMGRNFMRVFAANSK